MRTRNIILSLAFASGLFLMCGCADLDTVPQGSTVTEAQKLQTYENDPSKSGAVVNSIFLSLKNLMPNEDLLGECHNDFGFPSIMLLTDLNGEDMVSSSNGYNWFSSSIDFTSRRGTSRECIMVWNNLYKQVLSSNSLIQVIDPETPDPELQFNLAQGLAMRAYSYWYLIQLYQYNYKVIDPTKAPGVPVVTEKNTDILFNDGIGRNTVEDVYKQIFSDIDEAIDLLTASEMLGVARQDKRFIDLATAYGIRARINLCVGNMGDAADDAVAAIEFSDAEPLTAEEIAGPSFNDINASNWMWGIIVDETDDVVSSGIVNWVSHICSMTYGYALFNGGYRISQKLFETISETDVRRTWFLDEDGYNDYLATYYPDLYEELYSYGNDVPYMNVKFAPYNYVPETDVNANDMPLMRIEEMYYIIAEAEGDAQFLQDFVNDYRDDSYECADLSGEELADEIWRQRRIEFWGEGISYFDMMRLNKGINRVGSGFSMEYNAVIPADAPILLYPIPQREIDANKALSSKDQNSCISDNIHNYIQRN